MLNLKLIWSENGSSTQSLTRLWQSRDTSQSFSKCPRYPHRVHQESFPQAPGVDFCNQKICESHKLFLKYLWI